MSSMKKIFLIVFALFIVGLNFAIYTWTQSLKAEEVTYLTEARVDWLAFDKQGRIWAYSDGRSKANDNNQVVRSSGELRLYEKGEMIHVYTEEDSPSLGGTLEELAVDNMGRVWIAPSGSDRTVDLAVFDGIKWSTLLPRSASSGEYMGVTAISFDAQGRAWIGVYNKGLYIIDGEIWKNYTAENSDLIANFVFDIAFDGEGRAWLAIDKYDDFDVGGVNIFDGKEWQTFVRSNSPLISNHVSTITFDNQGRAWIGTSVGASVFDGENWESYRDDGSSGRFVFDNQGRVWMTTILFGDFVSMIKVFDGENWKYYFDPYRDVTHLTADHSMMTANRVITADRDGDIWISTYQDGVVIITPDSPQPTSYMQGILSFALVSGGWVYLTILLLVAWLAIAFNAGNSLGIVLAGLPIYLIWIAMLVSNNTIDYSDKFLFFFGNPAIFGTIGGIIGGTMEILFKRSGIVKTARWGLIGFIVGSILGFCYLSLGLMMQ